MALTDDGGNNMVMPVAPMYGGNYGGGFGNGFGGDGWWLILLLLCGWGGGFGGGWGMGGWGGMGNMLGFGIDFPWLLNGQNHINANTNAGFDHAATQAALGNLSTAVTSGFGDVQLGIAGVNQNICQTGNGIVNAVAGAQNALSAQMYGNEIANLNRSFDAQSAVTGGLTNIGAQLAQCCCENRAATQDVKYTIATEACATRAANAQNTQAILDKLCQLELDGVKNQVAAEQRENANLRTQLSAAQFAASQAAQTATFQQGLNNEVDALYNRLKNCPVNTVPVYGNQPIFTCPQSAYNSGCNCGCGSNSGFVN